MAEAIIFSLATKLLSTIVTPAFEKAYERARSIGGARDELEDLRKTITTIQAKLLDAEKKQKDSEEVKNWIKRVRDVLYDAEDLFDVVATQNMLTQEKLKGKKHLEEVRVFFSKLNPIASNDFISKKVKAIRKDLGNISTDMVGFKFVSCTENEKLVSGMGSGRETGSFVDAKKVIGRDVEKEQVVSFLCDEARAEHEIALISIVGIGGVGKSTLAQLVYNDGKIKRSFENRYWACISDIFDETVVTGKIYQALTEEKCQGFSLSFLQSSIRKTIDSKGKFLLVLDDLWDQDNHRGEQLRSLLRSDVAKGSKIIITTRNISVAKAMNADKTLELQGLSSPKSWELFRRLAFTKKQENDPAWISLGEKILKKCANVPLAITSIASLLRTKDTMREWRSIESQELSKIQLDKDPILSTLRLSYDHLPSHLKNCFAYCSLYEKGDYLSKLDLIYLWISQGYVKTKKDETLEMAGHAYFMELFRRSFFQDTKYDLNGEIRFCKMHDLFHDLALDVAGEECVTLTERANLSHNKFRHVNAACEIDESWSLSQSVFKADRLRSYICTRANSCSTRVLEQQVSGFKFLRVLILTDQRIEEAPSSIGELIYLRHLDLSWSNYTRLPDSVTKLVNLLTLDINSCKNLVELPRDIGKLISLRHFVNKNCQGLKEMPVSFGELTSLEHLNELRVSKRGGLDVLARMNLRGSLNIHYYAGGCSEDDFVLKSGQISDTLEMLRIEKYPSMRMPGWWREDPASRLPIVECLELSHCRQVKHLPPLRCLPCPRILGVKRLDELEYMKEEVVSTTPFFPSLQKLQLEP